MKQKSKLTGPFLGSLQFVFNKSGHHNQVTVLLTRNFEQSKEPNCKACILCGNDTNLQEAVYLHTSSQRIPVGTIGYTPCKLLGAVHVCVRIGVHACQVAEGGVVRTG